MVPVPGFAFMAAIMAVLTLLAAPARAGAPKVVVTVPPVHALVAAVMEGVGEPVLLVTGGASPHSVSLRPSQARALSEARVVVRVSRRLETFLERPLRNLAAGARVLTLSEIPGMTLYRPREGGLWEAHGHDDEHGHGRHAGEHEHDPHLWLDPANARRIALAASVALKAVYPEHAARFDANAAELKKRLDALDAELKTATGPLRQRPYFVFHDAYRYFEERYGLSPAGAITVSPERPPGAKRLSAIRTRIKALDAVCVFAEPQFEPRLVETLIDGTGAHAGTLDPVGGALEPGPELYFILMKNMAEGLNACLRTSS